MTTVEEILEYAENNRRYVRIAEHPNLPLLKLSYSNAASRGHMNRFTERCRGIIIERETLRVVARPFDKFYNLGERLELTDLPDEPYQVMEKVDGVLVIPYLYDGDLHLSTRGSFDNEFIVTAEELLTPEIRSLPHEQWTFMFELIHPDHRIVTDYGERQSLVLLGARHIETGRLAFGEELTRLARGIESRSLFADSIDSVLDSQKSFDGHLEEGWVVQYEGGLLIKIKRAEYLQQVQVAMKVHPKFIVKLLEKGQCEQWIEQLPEELQPIAREISGDLTHRFINYWETLTEVFSGIEKTEDRKLYAREVYEKAPADFYRGWIFQLRDSGTAGVRTSIWKRVAKDLKEDV